MIDKTVICCEHVTKSYLEGERQRHGGGQGDRALQVDARPKDLLRRQQVHRRFQRPRAVADLERPARIFAKRLDNPLDRGFGGQEINYLPAHDLPTSLLYWPTYLFETLRKKIRKL